MPEGTKVKVIAAVLDDGTAIGDESALASIFANRVKERDALKSVVDAFDAVLPAYHGPQALAALQDRLSALVDRTLNENLSPGELKNMIVHWLPDHMRV